MEVGAFREELPLEQLEEFILSPVNPEPVGVRWFPDLTACHVFPWKAADLL